VAAPPPPKAMVALLNSSEDVIARLQEALDEGGFRTVAAHVADVQMGVLDLIAWMSETPADVILVDLPRPDGRALNFLRLLQHVDVLQRCGWILTTTHKDALETMLTAADGHPVVVGQPDIAGQVADAARRVMATCAAEDQHE
jgi:DNA-binding NarL/FixJ family response regulator